MASHDLDLGDDHTLTFADWDPDLDLNPQYRDIADQLPAPRGRFAGYKHPETRDQDPDRQSKWQKIFDEESRIRNRGTGA